MDCMVLDWQMCSHLLAAMPAASSVPAAVEALLLHMKLAVLPAYAFPAVQNAAADTHKSSFQL